MPRRESNILSASQARAQRRRVAERESRDRAARETATLVYFVDEIQACSLEDLTPVDGIEVIQQYEDDKGCDRVMVCGPTAEDVIEYVRQEWGDEDPDWFADYIVARVECGEV